MLYAAYQLCSKHGYSDTNITDIVRSTGVAPVDLYVYFPSKLGILCAIYGPWLTRQFDDLEKSLLRVRDPRQRLQKILTTVWRDIPSADIGFANNMMQAISTTIVREGYSPALRLAIEERVAKLLDGSLLNLDHARTRELANIVLMAFDGYALNFHLKGGAVCPSKQLSLFADMLLNWPPAAGRRAAKTRKRSTDRVGANGPARVTG